MGEGSGRSGTSTGTAPAAAAGGYDESEEGDRQPPCGASQSWEGSIHIPNSTTESTRSADRGGWHLEFRFAR